jgi:hypothetical protein
MHCEMNLAKNFLKTISGKMDTVKVQRDLQRKGIRRHLWLLANPQRGGKMYKPAAPYVLSEKRLKGICANSRGFEDTVRLFLSFRQAHTDKEIRGPEISRLPCPHAAIIATSSTELACTRAEDGSDADVQGVQETMHKGVQPSRIQFSSNGCC